MKHNKAYQVLKKIYDDCQAMDCSVFYDFANVVHNDAIGSLEIGFDFYGAVEFTMLADCLYLFHDFGYDHLTEVIDYIHYEYKLASSQ